MASIFLRKAVNVAELQGFKLVSIEHDLFNFRKGQSDRLKYLPLESAAAGPRFLISG
jgi:hypothetical protein